MPTIRFDRTKYGRRLLADACQIRSLPRFITAPVAHRLQFYEIALVADGDGCLELDGSTVAIGRRRLLLTRPGEIRRWRLGPPRRLDGWLGFLRRRLHQRVLCGLALSRHASGRRGVCDAAIGRA